MIDHQSQKYNPFCSLFGNFNGEDVFIFSLQNKNGIVVKVINYGAAIQSILVPDRNGVFEDIVLGFENLAGYLQKGNRYFGAVVGPYANRIANGQFSLQGITYQLTQNRGNHSIHGGYVGLDKVIWKTQFLTQVNKLILSYDHSDGIEGYPGNLSIELVYTLTDNNELTIEYKAKSDKSSIINLTNHSYFNLAFSKEKTILNHELYIDASGYTEVDKEFIPTGKIIPIQTTPLDFTMPKLIGNSSMEAVFDFDHNMVLNKKDNESKHSATLYSPSSGRKMDIITNQPGIQFYTSNFLDGTLIGKGGEPYQKYAGICLETQHFPDSPNHDNFPSTELHPGESYEQKTTYRFSVN